MIDAPLQAGKDGCFMDQAQAAKELAAAGKWIVKKGMTWGSAGNLSVLMDADHLMITAGGARLDRLTKDAFTVYRLSDGLMEGGKPSKELPVHLAVYKAVPWAGAVVHASPFYATLAASSDLDVPSGLFVEDMYYLQRTARIGYFHPGSEALRKAVSQAAPDASVILMKNHGALLYDETLQEALNGLEVLENACHMSLCARQCGLKLDPVPGDMAADFLSGGYKKPRSWPIKARPIKAGPSKAY